jgi:hypothetical protein
VYRDCYFELKPLFASYQYDSKICAFVDLYVWYSRNYDWLLPPLWAIHLLNKHGEPNTKYFNGDKWLSPTDIARFIESKWIGIGIQSPYDSTVANSVRTAAFCALETILGYEYGDSKSRAFADKCIRAMQLTQVKDTGIISQYNANSHLTERYFRPNAIGGFYTFWKQDGSQMRFSYTSPSNHIKQAVEELFGHPDEHGDIKPSNIETTIVCSQVLRIYDCYKYGYNCQNTPADY